MANMQTQVAKRTVFKGTPMRHKRKVRSPHESELMPAKKRAPVRGAAKPATARAPKLGALPEWNLADLYAGIDDPAVKRDLDRADQYSVAFEEDFRGKLAGLAEGPGAGRTLAEAVKRYEALDDLLGRLGSVAGLVPASHTVGPR